MGLIHGGMQHWLDRAMGLFHGGMPWGHDTVAGSGVGIDSWGLAMGTSGTGWIRAMGLIYSGVQHWLEWGDGIDSWRLAMGARDTGWIGAMGLIYGGVLHWLEWGDGIDSWGLAMGACNTGWIGVMGLVGGGGAFYVIHRGGRGVVEGRVSVKCGGDKGPGPTLVWRTDDGRKGHGGDTEWQDQCRRWTGNRNGRCGWQVVTLEWSRRLGPGWRGEWGEEGVGGIG